MLLLLLVLALLLRLRLRRLQLPRRASRLAAVTVMQEIQAGAPAVGYLVASRRHGSFACLIRPSSSRRARLW